jgi:ribose transport system substrate-binding protein
VQPNWTGYGALAADYALVQTNCNLDAVLYTTPTLTNILAGTNAAVAQIQKLCSTCTTKVVDEVISTMATTIPSDVSANLQSDPKVNFILPGFDGMVSLIIPSVQLAKSSLQIISNSGTSQNLTYIQSAEVQTGDIEAAPTEELGWIAFDQAIRAAAGKAPLTLWRALPTMVVTKTNLAAATKYLNGSAYKAQFKAEWAAK